MNFWDFYRHFQFILVPAMAWVLAQLLKFLLHLIIKRKVDFTRLTGPGGLPSSHTALTVCLAACIGISEGTASPVFGLALVFALVVMYDAAGVRRAAGRQAGVLNRFIYHHKDPDYHFDEELKELIGHTPVEVIAGAALGILIAFLLMI